LSSLWGPPQLVDGSDPIEQEIAAQLPPDGLEPVLVDSQALDF